MIQSMTGYGKATSNINNKKVSVEIKSLNSKFLDLNLRMPNFYKEKELTLRSFVSDKIKRGKVDFSIYVELPETDKAYNLNKEVVLKYYNDLKELSYSLDLNMNENLFALATKMPETLSSVKQELDENEWTQIQEVIKTALTEFEKFRVQEGTTLQNELAGRINTILNLLEQIPALESDRMENVKAKISKSLIDQFTDKKIDENRFEQELIYYLEKLDITEEKVRLKGHCDYFLEVLDKEANQGKKLGFIGQEIGREINTLGSKANHQGMQKIVVQMKDELEKLKEQILNTL